MPSKSKKQAKLMSAVAHNPEFAQKVGIPQSVGKEFNDADMARKSEEDIKMVDVDKLSDITAMPWSPDRVPSIVRGYQEGKKMEPIKIGSVSGNNKERTLTDGNHRLWVARQLGIKQIPVSFSDAQAAAHLTDRPQSKSLQSDKDVNAAWDRWRARGKDTSMWDKSQKNIKKTEMLEITPDGKQERVEGNEPLKKDPKKRWKALKKALDHKKAFMDLEEEMGEDESEQPQGQDDASAMQQELAPDESQASEQQEQPSEDESQGGEAVSDGEEQPDEGNGNTHPDPQELIDALKEEGFSDKEIAYIVHGHHAPDIDESKAAKADATRAMSDIDIQNAQKQAELEHLHNEQSMAADREHKKRMQDLEYEQAQKKQALIDQDTANKQRMADSEYEHALSNNPAAIESAHKQRMLDLEYEKAKREHEKSDGSDDDLEIDRQMKMLEVEKKKLELNLRKEEMKMELEFKKREHELKLKMMEAQLKEQAKQKGEISGIKHQQKLKDAKNPVKKELKENTDD